MKRLAIVLGLLLCSGCAHQATAPAKTVGTFTLTLSGSQKMLRLDDRGSLTGPQVQLERDGDSIRGQAFGRTVDAQFSKGAIRGNWGGGPLQLYLTRDARKLEVRGMVGGARSLWKLSDEGFQGDVGGCGYSLQPGPSGLSGNRRCEGQGFEPAEVRPLSPQDLGGDELWVFAISLLLAG